jgi:GTP-binding protein HflX
LLVGVELKGEQSRFSVSDSLDELALLAHTAGIDVAGRAVQRLSRIDPATFVGSGKVEEIAEMIPELGVNLLIFDDELSPRHQRELEKVLGEQIRILDRSALILDIFAQHARTREGALQVELAQYEYRLPRLTRQWTHLARQAGGGAARGGAGGVGLRGPGETQLEVDRREIRRRISKLKEELENVRAHRQRHRAQRERAGMLTVALVGYTNAGKSTLLNALSGADVYVANQLFATLDPTTRRVRLPSGRVVLVSDTVGFIQKLPVTLVAAFRATLEEVNEADLLLHVVDVSHSLTRDHIEVVEDTLVNMDAVHAPKVLVLNKVDRGIHSQPVDDYTELGYEDVVYTSALEKTGLDTLLETLDRVLGENMVLVEATIPYDQAELLDELYKRGVVAEEEYLQEGIRVKASVPPSTMGRLKRLVDTEQDMESSSREESE